MIIDSSAILAVLRAEPRAEEIRAALLATPNVAISAGTLVETTIVVDGRRDPVASARLDALLRAIGPEVVPVDAAQAAIARTAYRDFGRGSGHKAGLNFGDCFSYALAKERDEPLLYVGDDFARTDLASVL
ncbi:type II toxin-antitoxin system VapC family toxin [Microbacterium sp.]|uniref:type II toxin-antitoxin system VapC family toxin n=1 Tax=Microbacterium sp. TaxID=51671 RepID=UPI0039E3D0AF